MKDLFNINIQQNDIFYNLSSNISGSSEYGGGTLTNIAKGKLWG